MEAIAILIAIAGLAWLGHKFAPAPRGEEPDKTQALSHVRIIRQPDLYDWAKEGEL